MDKEKEEKKVECPVCRIFQELGKISKEKSQFFDHLNLSKVEFLKAIRALVDERIETLDAKREARGEKTATRIEVE
jgi:CRISPR/Cas system CSM-associated protein Csm3 (group 7 of RAMP superfamily)